MTKRQELEDKIYRGLNHTFSDDPKVCVNMQKMLQMLIDEMYRLHEERLK